MDTKSKSIIMLSVALALALGCTIYLWWCLHASADDAEHTAARAAIMEASIAELRAQEEAQSEERDRESEEHAAALAMAEAQLEATRIDYAHRRTVARRAATTSDTGLRMAVAEAADVATEEVTVDASSDPAAHPLSVRLTYSAALHLIDYSLSLRQQVAEAIPIADLRVAEAVHKATVPLLDRAQRAERRDMELTGELRLAALDLEHERGLRRQARADAIAWGVGAGVAGLVLGVVAGGVGVAYISR